MANPVNQLDLPPTETDKNFDDFDDIEYEQPQAIRLDGWRIERNTNGYYRWRWQLKNETGESETYATSSGGVGYKRGSKYLPLAQALMELHNGKSKKRR